MSSKEDFVNIDDVSGDLIKCYQIQVDDSGKVTPTYIGSFKEIPLITHTTILYDQNKDMLNTKEKRVVEGVESSKSKKSKSKKSKSKKSKSKKNNIYRIHIVTYIMPEESIENEIYKIVGMVVQKNKKPESIASLDLRFNTKNNKFEYIYCDHIKDTVDVVSTLEKFSGTNDILNNLMERMFEDPMKKLILS
jgi:hypothetical protein